MGAQAQALLADWDELGLPRAFGNYLLLDRIGRGGMAEIFLARATNELGVARRVVVKQIAAEYSSDPVFTRSLVSEAKLAARLSHKNIVRVLDLGREEDRLYIAMEYVEGFDLNQLLGRLSRERIPLPLEFALLIVRSVLSALDHAHRALDANGTPLGLVHRDVSPANVLISLEGEVRLCDFGIARAFAPEYGGDEEPLFQHALWAGKGWYVAPEHARGQDVDARSDVFAVGVLLWELCAGRRMYKRDDMSWLDPERAMAIPSLPDREFPESEWLHKVLDKALAFDPAMRFQSAHEMLAELEEYALATQLMASQLRFAAFLAKHFEVAFAELRLLRERAADRAVEAWHADSADAGESGSRPLPQARQHAEPLPLAAPPDPDPVPVAPSMQPPSAAPLPAARQTPAFEYLAGGDDLDIGSLQANRIRPVYLVLVGLVIVALAYWLATH
ncbi:MAG TPA: serine/threonine-protein kinase [Polyangiales bacterium]|nr:serine/threonine-protein kinase [Polyangiales bacterium]